MYIYLHKTNNHLCVYMYAYMDTCKVFKQVTWCFLRPVNHCSYIRAKSSNTAQFRTHTGHNRMFSS